MMEQYHFLKQDHDALLQQLIEKGDSIQKLQECKRKLNWKLIMFKNLRWGWLMLSFQAHLLPNLMMLNARCMMLDHHMLLSHPVFKIILLVLDPDY